MGQYFQVCDDQWHHYAINVRFPDVELYIDGQLFRSSEKKNPEVIDDWPLHPTKGINTTLTVGACWQVIEKYCCYDNCCPKQFHI